MMRRKTYSEATAQDIDAEVHAIINGCYNRAREIIYANRDKLEMIANALLEYETLDGVQVRTLCSWELSPRRRHRRKSIRPRARRPRPRCPKFRPSPRRQNCRGHRSEMHGRPPRQGHRLRGIWARRTREPDGRATTSRPPTSPGLSLPAVWLEKMRWCQIPQARSDA